MSLLPLLPFRLAGVDLDDLQRQIAALGEDKVLQRLPDDAGTEHADADFFALLSHRETLEKLRCNYLRLIEKLAESFANPADRLLRPMLVLDQREAHVRIAEFAEADARRDRHFRFLEKELRELDRAHRFAWLGNLRP